MVESDLWLGGSSVCMSDGAGSGIPNLSSTQPLFPSLDVFHELCPVLPTVRQLQNNLDAVWLSFIRAYGETIEALFSPLLQVLLFTERLALAAPWWLMIVLLMGFVWLLTRSVKMSLIVAATLLAIGFLGMWRETMQTLSFISVCTTICIALGIPVGLMMARSNRLASWITPLLDFLQTMPSFVYLVPVVMLFGIGKVAGAIAVIFYAIPPVIRLTNLGIRNVDPETVEAAESFGVSSFQKLWGVEFPLALPTIMAGINQTTMMSLAMVVVASMVAVRGLGVPVLESIQELSLSKGLFYGLAVVALAIIFDRVTRAAVIRTQRHLELMDQ